MKINWKIRFQNKAWLGSFFALLVSFVYKLLGMLDVFPAISENMVLQLCDIVLMALGAVGVVSDPTTPGVTDSKRALQYVAPGVMDSQENSTTSIRSN